MDNHKAAAAADTTATVTSAPTEATVTSAAAEATVSLAAAGATSTSAESTMTSASAAATVTNPAAGTEQVPLSTETEVAEESPNTPEGGVKRKREDGEVGEGTASSDDKSRPRHPLHKTSLCSHFRGVSGACHHGDSCRFAHNEEELRVRPDGSWDPTSERVKKMMKSENGEKKAGVVEAVNNGIMMTDVFSGDDGDPQLNKCLVHLPQKWVTDKLKDFLTEQGVTFKSAKKKRGMSVGFVSFETSEQVNTAVELLDGKSVGSRNIKVADVLPRSYDDKIKAAQKEQPGLKCGSGEDAECLISGDEVKNGKIGDVSGSKQKSVRDAVTPLAHMSYPEQLELKKNTLIKTLKKLPQSVCKACPDGVPHPEWIVKAKISGTPACKLEGIIESPLINGYRNKCEFSVGCSVQGKPTVGFLLGSFREGVTAVEEPVDCPNVSEIACKYASIFQEFLQGSTLPIWNRFKNTGFWRQLTVREGRGPRKGAIENMEADVSEVLLMVQICSSDTDVDLVNDELKKMSLAFSTGAVSSSPPLPLTVLVVQDHKGISNVAPADAPLRTLYCSGDQIDPSSEAADTVTEAQIHDSICDLQFRISPTAFFQVNTLAAEKLYTLAGDWAGLGPNTLLFDVCCGTGTIGLTLAHRVGLVVGIEMNAYAISDAKRNAEINGIKNCRFVCSKAEDIMGYLLKEYLNPPEHQNENEGLAEKGEIKAENGTDPGKDDGHEMHDQGNTDHPEEDDVNEKKQFDNVVAIVDPPRNGLHPVVIKALRTNPRLRRLVYISCNPESMVADAIELCTPSSGKSEKPNRGFGWRGMSRAGMARHRAKSMPDSEPFIPVKSMAVDLFPHTPHCELVMLLER